MEKADREQECKGVPHVLCCGEELENDNAYIWFCLDKIIICYSLREENSKQKN